MAFMFARRWRRGRRQTYAGEAYERAAAARAHACAGLRQRAAVRDLGVRAALATLVDHAAALTEAHDAVRRRGARHGAAQRDALERFEDDLDVRARRPVSFADAIDGVYFSRRWRGDGRH